MDKNDFYLRIMDFNFIGRRIRVGPKRLCWCICETINRDGEMNFFPCVEICNSALLYDIMNDALEFKINSGGNKTFIHKAQISLVDSGFLFCSDNNLKELLPFEKLSFFREKVYNKELESAAQRFF